MADRRENNPRRTIMPAITNTVDAGGHVRFKPMTSNMIPEDVQRYNRISAERSLARGDREAILRKGEAEADTKRLLRKGTPFEAKKETIKIDSSKTVLGKEV